jgi:alkanesulfonate monooxygenase SsuD/methylene tetrahydromethanopterin reductase-like flavin-dependent oxidoreductase (luciferase family)
MTSTRIPYMERPKEMDFGIALAPGVDAWKWVKRAETLGFSHAWLYDTQLLCADFFVAAALAAANTRRIRIGPGVLVPTNRIAPVAANGLASLSALAPGRIDFGVGTGFTARLTMGLGPMPLRELREYLRVVRGMLAGETVEWEHEGVRRKIRFLNPDAGLIDIRSRVPLHLSAFAPKARALAAEIADGWMNFITLQAMALHEINAMAESCRACGRDTKTLYKTGMTLGCVLRDGEDAGCARARAQAGPLAAVLFHGLVEGAINPSLLPPDLQRSFADYRRVYDAYEPADARYLQLHTVHLMWVRREEDRFVTPDLIGSSTFTGTAEELRDRIRELRDAGYDQLAVQLVHGQEDAMDDWARVFERV